MNVFGGSGMIFMYICTFFLRFIYFFLKLLPTNKNKILFLSRQSDKTSLDYNLLINDIQKRYSNYKIKVITKRIEKNFKDVFFKSLSIIFKQMYHLATSKICIVDGYNIPVSILKHKKSLKIFQIWHSLGAIKMFGCQILITKKQKKIAKIFRMHQNYNYILSASVCMNQYYRDAFNSHNAIIFNYPLPRVDYLINNHKKIRNSILKDYYELGNKKNILYAPTFRNTNNYKIDELIKKIDFNKYNLIIKLHPNIKCADYSKYDIPKYSAFSLLTIADYVITDYSGFLLESLIINKPVYIYAYDYEEYIQTNGLNIDLSKEFKFCFFKDADSLVNCINDNQYQKKEIKKLQKKYIIDTSGQVTPKLVNYIIKNGGQNAKN